MREISGNEPAMPCIESINHNGESVEVRTSDAGLTIRQQFAAMAMQGLLANMALVGRTHEKTETVGHKLIAQLSVEMADALISELNKPQP